MKLKNIPLSGKWQLNSNYDLELRQYNNYLLLEGEIISVDSGLLVFQVKTHDEKGRAHFQLIKLSGLWQADRYNRLTFVISKKAEPDTLVFKGNWQVNKNQQIVYNYEKTDLATKSKSLHKLIFEGFWQISEKNKLTYILAKDSKFRFDFRVQLESPNLYPRRGVIKYRIGIGLRDDKTYRAKIISLYGAWKFNRNLGLTYEMDYGKGLLQKIEFGAEFDFDQANQITFRLTNKRNEALGISLTFSHRFLKKLDARAFLRFRKARAESAVEAGVGIPF